MFDIGWSELLVIGIVALIVIGPKDLPGMFHTLGRFTAKIRRMAREFQNAMEDAAKESGVKDTASDLRKMTSAKNLGLDRLKDAADKFDKWEPAKDALKGKTLGPETAALSEERAEKVQKIRDNMAKKAEERIAAEKAAAAATEEAAAKPAKKAASKPAGKASAKPAAEDDAKP